MATCRGIPGCKYIWRDVPMFATAFPATFSFILFSPLFPPSSQLLHLLVFFAQRLQFFPSSYHQHISLLPLSMSLFFTHHSSHHPFHTTVASTKDIWIVIIRWTSIPGRAEYKKKMCDLKSMKDGIGGLWTLTL